MAVEAVGARRCAAVEGCTAVVVSTERQTAPLPSFPDRSPGPTTRNRTGSLRLVSFSDKDSGDGGSSNGRGPRRHQVRSGGGADAVDDIDAGGGGRQRQDGGAVGILADGAAVAMLFWVSV
ncbi:hypothetical protein HanRHA438_Chr14g0637121 [Helianthus annuus]|uniref:Uncharacterized protein n=1 Tax=Helianthus annuus TaxID=4232 RepID=A0A251SG74_HELAN|nr:uncharacterized protein LOC110908372 [Helianthus annuus]KAF5767689.1 hypothetical protein HanXRQr2_Chr14g0627331 [Helianthus annuus]KAJ0463181.1 hypothetical protein HanHA300_Chr14g0512331 [Helianthus annuus]KAJ0467049.1 hypothetical protein HanIR_Chr14g0678931 [Helianthus annuus]KAJ0484553.1 hypothetical protein HanHA89_Chr14g0545401 [Helianthus annuus]KAJ0655108.1 hypothetical protein HanLR1_Chr14g0514691 [Helianthus annuus]